MCPLRRARRFLLQTAKNRGLSKAPGQMAFRLNQASFSGARQCMPKHLAILHARENNIRIIMLSEPVFRNVIAFASFQPFSAQILYHYNTTNYLLRQCAFFRKDSQNSRIIFPAFEIFDKNSGGLRHFLSKKSRRADEVMLICAPDLRGREKAIKSYFASASPSARQEASACSSGASQQMTLSQARRIPAALQSSSHVRIHSPSPQP